MVLLLLLMLILLYGGSNKNEHDENLRKVFNKLKLVNIRLNRDKCIAINEITYLGYKISANGVTVRSILNI